MEKALPELILRKFQNENKTLPIFKNEQEEKVFLQLQKYNLLYVTPKGFFKLTRKGEQALKGDVEKYIQLERYEEKLIKDSFKKSGEEKIIFFAGIPMILVIVIILIAFFIF